MKTRKSILAIVVFLLVTATSQAQEIITAATAGNLEKVKELVEKDPQQVQLKDATGRTPLHWACRGVHFDVLKYLVEKGANINALDNNGIAPLHSLTTRAHLEGMSFLLAHHADINIRTPQNDTPLHYAAITRNAAVVKILLENGAEPSARNRNGQTPLDLAAAVGNKEAVDSLLDKGAVMDASGERAYDVLLTAAANGLERLAKLVMEKEGQGLFKDGSRNKNLMLEAVKGGSVEIVKTLTAENVPLETKADIYGWTPIHYAACQGRAAMVEFLMGIGVDIDARNAAGESAYNLAASMGNKELQDLIIRRGGHPDPKKFPPLTGPYLGQTPPSSTPEIFAPGIVSTDSHEFSSCFSLDGKEFYFTRSHPVLNRRVVMFSRLVNGIWTEPEVAPFVENMDSFEPFVTPDNKRLYFQSGRVVNGGLHMVTLFVDRTDKGWGEVKDPGDPFNPDKTMHISATSDGTIYTTDISAGFTTRTSAGPSGPGRECLGMMKPVNGRYEKLEKLGPPLNAHPRSQHPWISPDESWMIFSAPRPGQPIPNTLFVAWKSADGSWSDPQELKLGTSAGQAFVTFDGKYLFFTSMKQGKGDLYWVSTKIIEDLKPKQE